jgi:hypothetical protein
VIPVLALLVLATQEAGRTIRVPADQPTIRKAVDAARPGDTVLLSTGTYRENVTVDKRLTVASPFLESKDPRHVEQTVIDGGGKTVITVTKGADVRIVGLTIRNGNDGICCDGGRIEAVHNRILGNDEGISFEGGRGIVRSNLIEGSGDDGIDCDDATDVVVEENVIRNNKDDGLECRLHPYKGPVLNVVIRNNLFSGNREDGVQLIDYPGLSDRAFRIERNVFHATAMAAVGCMPDGETRENYGGAPLQEPVLVLNNTFVDNHHGLTGGDNLVAANNVFVGTRKTAMRRLQGDSRAAHNLFWRNGTDFDDAPVEREKSLFADPMLDGDHRLKKGSPCIDAGTAALERKGLKAFELAKESYAGAAPDLGAFESK